MTDTTVKSKPEGYVFGRPTKYRPEMCEKVIALGAGGASKTEIAYELGVTRNTLDNWASENPDFLGAITRAKEAEQVWWEREGRGNLKTQGYQSSMWSRSMAARFPDEWRETTRNEHTGKDGGPMEFSAMLGKMTKNVFPGDETDSG